MSTNKKLAFGLGVITPYLIIALLNGILYPFSIDLSNQVIIILIGSGVILSAVAWYFWAKDTLKSFIIGEIVFLIIGFVGAMFSSI